MIEVKDFPAFPGVKLIKPLGRIDRSNYKKFSHEAIALVERLELGQDIPRFILVDMQDVKFIDSCGLGALIGLLKLTRSKGKKMALCSINQNVRLLFRLTAMSRIFDIFINDRHFFSNLENSEQTDLSVSVQLHPSHQLNSSTIPLRVSAPITPNFAYAVS
jgi:anti-sigma B factor antagonist